MERVCEAELSGKATTLDQDMAELEEKASQLDYRKVLALQSRIEMKKLLRRVADKLHK